MAERARSGVFPAVSTSELELAHDGIRRFRVSWRMPGDAQDRVAWVDAADEHSAARAVARRCRGILWVDARVDGGAA